MRDVLLEYDRLTATGAAVGRAVVTDVWGSAPRPPGACLLATAEGRMAGSVCGGCVEGATVTEIAEALGSGEPKLVSYDVTTETAWAVGLACNGTIGVFVEPGIRPEWLQAAQGEAGHVLATVVGGPAIGTAFLVDERGAATGPLPPVGATAGMAIDGPPADALRHPVFMDAVCETALAALAVEASEQRELTLPSGVAVPVFFEVLARPPKLVVVGAVHVAMELVPLARRLGYRTIVTDGRAAFLTRERFPEADELILAWPEEAFARIGLDRATYVCVLSHDPKFDEPAVELALRSPARYVGAIGSRATQATRRERLAEAGVSAADVARLRGPIGLKLGGRRPAEVALAIMAEITVARYGSGPPLAVR